MKSSQSRKARFQSFSLGNKSSTVDFVPSDSRHMPDYSHTKSKPEVLKHYEENELFNNYSGPLKMSPYRDRGIKYNPFVPQIGITTDGVASWYGGFFNGRKTANGEIYSENELTAAHKTYVMGTVLRVDNPENGKSVVVRINDRGPFVKGRDIDLSKHAMALLGLVDKGVAHVKLTVLSVPRRSVPVDITSIKKPDFNPRQRAFESKGWQESKNKFERLFISKEIEKTNELLSKLRCPCGKCKASTSPEMSVDVIKFLNTLESEGYPYTITSGFRCRDYEISKGRSGLGSHPRGLAVDISSEPKVIDSIVRNEIIGGTPVRFGRKSPTMVHVDFWKKSDLDFRKLKAGYTAEFFYHKGKGAGYAYHA